MSQESAGAGGRGAWGAGAASAWAEIWRRFAVRSKIGDGCTGLSGSGRRPVFPLTPGPLEKRAHDCFRRYRRPWAPCSCFRLASTVRPPLSPGRREKPL